MAVMGKGVVGKAEASSEDPFVTCTGLGSRPTPEPLIGSSARDHLATPTTATRIERHGDTSGRTGAEIDYGSMPLLRSQSNPHIIDYCGTGYYLPNKDKWEVN
jgi:hypothetical protein